MLSTCSALVTVPVVPLFYDSGFPTAIYKTPGSRVRRGPRRDAETGRTRCAGTEPAILGRASQTRSATHYGS